MPDDEASLRRLGRSMGFTQGARPRARQGVAHHRREVRRLHEKLFYRPLLEAVARVPGDGARLSPEAAEARLAALGYADPKAALRHLEALTSGVTRDRRRSSARCCRRCSSGSPTRPTPTPGCSASAGSARALGRDAVVPQDAARRGPGRRAAGPACSATSRYATDLLEREPQGVRMLGERPRAAAPPRR